MTDEARATLLKYNLPLLKRVLVTSFIALLLVAGIVAIVSIQTHGFAAFILACCIVGIVVWGPFTRLVAELACFDEAVMLETIWGVRIRVPWSGVKVFRRTYLGFSRLETENDAVFLLLPPDMRSEFIKILREASDARIIGFDEG